MVKTIFNQPVKNDMRTYDNVWKKASCQGDDQITGCLLNYPNFNVHYKLITIDLRK